MDRARKEQIVSELGQIFENSGVVVVARYAGMSVASLEEFRGQMREAGGFVRVAKNRLTRIALKGSKYEGMSALLEGMTVLAYSEDPVTAAKVANAFSEKNPKLELVGGSLDGSTLDAAGVKQVAKLPTREELIASLVGCIISPAANIAGVVGAPASGIASVLSTIEEKAAA